MIYTIDKWVWATFEAQNSTTNPNRCKVLGCNYAWGSDPPTTPGAPTSLSTASPRVMDDANLAPEWKNNRLDGVQIDFLTSSGQRSLAIPSSKEEGSPADLPWSSAVICHARSTAATGGARPLAQIRHWYAAAIATGRGRARLFVVPESSAVRTSTPKGGCFRPERDQIHGFEHVKLNPRHPAHIHRHVRRPHEAQVSTLAVTTLRQMPTIFTFRSRRAECRQKLRERRHGRRNGAIASNLGTTRTVRRKIRHGSIGKIPSVLRRASPLIRPM